jgi:exodeoxyribonuclease VII small subunit
MNKTYKQLRTELDDLMNWFDSEDIDVEQALAKYEQAEQIIRQLEAYLKDTELKITKLKK